MNALSSLQSAAAYSWAGPILALTTFATIGIGHMLVRRLHKRYGTRPGIPFFILGGLLLLASLFTAGSLPSAVLGLVGVTFFWDGIEFYRQEKRMQQEK